MSVSVSMPQLGESVTEGTVTRWLKREGERVEADEPLLEVSTDKVDTEIPSPVSGVLRGITVAEDETVAVGAELAVIDEEGAAGPGAVPAAGGGAADAAPPEPAAAAAAGPPEAAAPAGPPEPAARPAPAPAPAAAGTQGYNASGYEQPYQEAAAPPAYPAAPPPAPAYQPPAPGYQPRQSQPGPEVPAASYPPPAPAPPAYQPPPPSAPAQPPAPPQPAPAQPAFTAGTKEADAGPQPTDGAALGPTPGAEGPYVTPLVRKLAAEHGIDLATVSGTGVGGRIRKQDVLDAARDLRGAPGAADTRQAPPVAAPQQAGPSAAPQQAASLPAAPQPAAVPAPGAETAAPARPAIVPSSLRGTTEKLSRSRQVIAQRMVESLQTSAQLTTVVEADVTAIARLRDRAKAAFEAREGVKLSFLPFFALATVEALKVHPRLNAVIDTANGQVTYHDAEHLGIAVDTERGLMVPVIRKAGDLNIGGLARKIADLAARTRAAQVSPDELSGGTFTLTNTGSRGALFDTPIINQPQVGILGTGTVVKRAVVVEDPALGEVIAVRSMVYLALTYDHRLVDGADAARFLVTIKERLEEGAFETELGV
jgi:pyruvate dehydrogenase E2 component (dihydrolipoamide acetyltransferase)